MAKTNGDSKRVLTQAEATGMLQAYKTARAEYLAAEKAFDDAKPGMTEPQIAEGKKAVEKKEATMLAAIDALGACKALADKPKAKALFDSYSKAAEQIRTAKEAIEVARVKASEVVEEILLNLGKGPFTYNGKVYNVTRRGPLYFMKSPGSNEITEI
jgi:hypothetical protein